ncbi:MAG: hypothetical protein Q7R95_11725, partial [bacterium]|nr:hypothetical protein [bacterium]
RRRSKCLEVLDLVNKNGGQNIVKGLRLYENPTRERAGAFLSEDSFFCYFGFGAGIFEPVELDFIDSFAQEPITMETYLNKEKRPNLFHRID